jgi:S-adenosylmethionine decarboxylase
MVCESIGHWQTKKANTKLQLQFEAQQSSENCLPKKNRGPHIRGVIEKKCLGANNAHLQTPLLYPHLCKMVDDVRYDALHTQALRGCGGLPGPLSRKCENAKDIASAQEPPNAAVVPNAPGASGAAETPKTLEAPYAFVGQHLIASYYECDMQAMGDLPAFKNAMFEGCRAAGATVLGSVDHVFPAPPGQTANGYTIAVILSESHNCAHVYPEYAACFVDLFTCGTTCQPEKFDAVIQDFLKPKRANTQLLNRQ